MTTAVNPAPPQVSVVISAFNAAAYVADAVSSALDSGDVAVEYL